jgi:hypothetical protein
MYTKNHLKRNKKSQMKMAETISILIVFFILIFSAFIIYTNQKSEKIKKQIEEKEMMKSVEIATRAYMLPEIQCSESQCIGCSGAMDLLKLDAVSNFTNANTDDMYIFKSPEYFQEFGYATITVQLVYPNSTDVSDLVNYNWTIYNRTAPGIRNVINPIYVPINVFNPFDNQCYFGVMEVVSYS